MNNDNLWAPWRAAYLGELKRRADAAGQADLATGPFLSEYFRDPARDEVNHVVFRDAHGIILLNRYPYAGGHLLVALGEPRPTLLDYDPPQRAAFWRLVEVATDLVQRTFHPQGINIGINQGRAAGAGLPDHLHAHLVPRWNGDTNAMSVVARVQVIPASLDDIAAKYRAVASP
jgi:ATP adenylyltransferase